MKVRCIFNHNDEVPELIGKYGYEKNSILHISKQASYIVYGMIDFANGLSPNSSIEYIIRDDLDGISCYNALLFEVLDSRLDDVDWHFSFGKNGMEWILGYNEFVNDREHYESAIQGDEPGYSKLKAWCDMIDKLNEIKE